MNPLKTTIARRPAAALTQTLTLALLAGAASPARAAIVDWTGNGSASWATGSAWTTGSPPAPGDTARLGAHAAAENSFVFLNMNDFVAEMEITDGIILQTNGHKLVVSGRTTLSGENLLPGNTVYSSRIDVKPATGIAFQTGELFLDSGADFWMRGGEAVVVNDFNIGVDCSVYGWGEIRLVNSDAEFINNGRIQIRQDTDTVINHAGGFIDLDGATGNGYVSLNQYDSDFGGAADLTLMAQGLADPFSGLLRFGGGSDLDMDLQQPWRLDQSSEVVFYRAYEDHTKVSRILGAGVELAGLVEVSTDANAMLASETIEIDPSATFDLQEDSTLYMGAHLGPAWSDITVSGGLFTFEQGASLLFNGDTTVEDAMFDMVDDSGAGGSVKFFGPTTYIGGFTTDGYAQQNSDPRVALPTTFNAATFDIDGDTNTTAWDIEYATTFNIGHTGAGFYPTFSGTFDIAAGIQPRVIMNVDADRWVSYGTLNLSGYSFSHLTRIGGSALAHYGDMTLPSGKAAIDAEISFASPSTTDLQNANADLRLNQNASIAAGATFTGLGTLRVGSSSMTSLGDGASVDVRVANDGGLGIASPLFPGSSFGTATVADFVQSTSGELIVSVGGYGVGAEYDRINATGPGSEADGIVSPVFKQSNGKGFVPSPGDTFEFFTAPQGYTGTFGDTSPTNIAVNSGIVKSAVIEWDIQHSATSAQIRINDVTLYCYADTTTSHANPGDKGYGVPDGVVDGADLAYFVEFWLAGSFKVADLNTKNVNPGEEGWGEPDGEVDGADLSFYVERWIAGCS